MLLKRPVTFISIHALREEGDDLLHAFHELLAHFYPRPPRGGRLMSRDSKIACFWDFYPRPPRGGRHKPRRPVAGGRNFYPRPPRGGRQEPGLLQKIEFQFLSTPSARRATAIWVLSRLVSRISIHALREEGDDGLPADDVAVAVFLSTPSARRATAKTETKSLFSNKLYNILHEFRRALIYNGSKSYPNHAK